MDKVCDFDKCTGCGLCASSCAKGCISMSKRDSLGHLYPIINTEACIDCGLCQKKCPVLNPVELNQPTAAYAAWSRDDDDYKSSTSGGAASVISQYVIENGGVVYGCAILPDIEVKHIRVDNISDIRKLKGSKYVQSNMEDVYPQLKDDVKTGRLTLFVGTPCQVAAVKKLFKDQPDNLILVDLICHGVPSLDILKKHIRKVACYPHYSNVVFRKGYYLCLSVEVDGKKVYEHYPQKPRRYNEWYVDTFEDGFTFRDSCYGCKYACLKRASDITIGDFWGLGKKIPADDIPAHPNGCSVVLPSTDTGNKIVEAISSKVYLYKRTVEEAAEGNYHLRRPNVLGMRRRMFRRLFPFMGRLAYNLVVFDKMIIWRIVPQHILEYVLKKRRK